MATVSFDSEFKLQDEYIESFFYAIEHPETLNMSLAKTEPLSNAEIERGEELLKKYFGR